MSILIIVIHYDIWFASLHYKKKLMKSAVYFFVDQLRKFIILAMY